MSTTKSASFTPAADGIDPKIVPAKTLFSGARIPAIGLGTFGSDHVTGQQVGGAVLEAAKLGYRHFDCASVYGRGNHRAFPAEDECRRSGA